MEEKIHDHTGHGASKLMIVMMLGCLVIGAASFFNPSFYLDLAFVLTMGFCIGHHLFHRYRPSSNLDQDGTG